MKYVKYWFHLQKFFFAKFSRFRTFYTERKKIPLSRSVAVGFWMKFEAQLSQLGVPHTQNFEIPLKLTWCEISFENFQKFARWLKIW
jgi:hypothetical protein